jgi:glycosyltransferase involved in cell wall biosynthesis
VLPRVGIDAHFLSRPEGNRTYVLSLLRALARAGSRDRFELVVYATDPAQGASLLGEDAAAFRWEGLPRSALLRFAAGVPRVQRQGRLDLWHATFVAPRGPARLVLAVHDALALVRPELLPARTRAKLRLLLAPSIRRARAVVVPTRAVASELEALGLGARARVVPIGVDDRIFFPPSATDGPEGEAEGYVLHVGRADPRKRIPLLLRAFARAGRGRLVLAGPLEGARLEGPRVAVVSSPDERSLAELYRGARALVFASAGEGLGLPVLEALASGTPVIATAIPPVLEVAGDAALALVPPDDEPALAAALARAFDLGPAERAALARRGLERARAFSLDAMARGTEEAWRAALA